MQMSFGSMEMLQRVRKNKTLMKVDALINWEALRPQFKKLYKRDSSHAGGQEPFDALLMFKAILLAQWHCLSDEKLEEALNVRIDFMQFCGLTLSDPVPDATTICRFRNRLIKANKLDALLASINAQLQRQNLMVKEATGAVIDATLIESAVRPNKSITIETDSEGQQIIYADGSQPGIICDEKLSADADATWVKKGKKSHLGYRSYVTVDATDGYVRGVHTAPANESETKHFIQALDKANFKKTRVYADKGYASKSNREHLHKQKIKSGIMHKGQRNKPLSARQIKANKLISKRRYIVEQFFGTAKRLFGMGRSSYMSTAKVNAQVIMKGICINLLKAANKILMNYQIKGKIRLKSA